MMSPKRLECFKQDLASFLGQQKSKKYKALLCKLYNRDNCSEYYHSTPGKAKLDGIASVGETAFQRAIINKRYSTLIFHKEPDRVVDWYDIELPVVLNRMPRRPCIDLIGFNKDIPVLCELKYFNKSPSYNPLYAVVELFCYYYFIMCNCKELDCHNVHHSNMKPFKWSVISDDPLQLLVVANERYWDHWLKGRTIHSNLNNNISALCKNIGADIHLFKAPDEDFLSQKVGGKPYKPIVSSNIWEEIALS